jgi:hypothetical protein
VYVCIHVLLCPLSANTVLSFADKITTTSCRDFNFFLKTGSRISLLMLLFFLQFMGKIVDQVVFPIGSCS